MELGRTLIVLGVVLVVAGLLFVLVGRIPWLGRLPGDIVWRRGNATVYFPLTTLILVNLAIAVALWIFNRR